MSAPAPGWEHFETEADVGVEAWGPTRSEAFAQASLGVFNGRGAISWTHRRDDDVALPGEPKRCVTKLDHRKIAWFLRIKRNPMIHDQKRKWSLPDGTDHVRQHWNR